MSITESWGMKVSMGLLLLLAVVSCSRREPAGLTSAGEGALPTPPALEEPAQLAPKTDSSYRDVYKNLLSGIWNQSGIRVSKGVEEVFSWGKSSSDHECVIIDLNVPKPYFLAEGELLFVKGVDFSNEDMNELLFTMMREGGEVRGVFSVKFYNKRCVRFTDLSGNAFLWNIYYEQKYYKISGPGAEDP